MHMSGSEFLAWPNKSITLLGMSGVGKTTLANRLPKEQWFHYSGDYRIGTRYLDEPILDNIKRQAMQVGFLRDLLRSDSIYIASNVTVHNLEPVATFLGKLGDPARGGLPLEEFKRRQRLHREAEINAMRDVEAFIGKAREIYGYAHFLNDAGGSLCELDDRETLEVLRTHTVILYLRADPAMEEALLERSVSNPKPLYYQEPFLDEQLVAYCAERNVSRLETIDPDDFVRWMFPRLLAHRRPRYQALADEYGYTIDAGRLAEVRNEAQFLELVAQAMG